MEMNMLNQLFVVGGASSGLGRATAERLLKEGGKVIAVARGAEKLKELLAQFPEQVEPLIIDITSDSATGAIIEKLAGRQLHGIVVNAGGPPAMTVLESKLSDWDQAYKSVLRWKVDLVTSLLPLMIKNKYGRVLFIESASVKQPMPNLVLSNAFRLAVIGFLKTLSQEVAAEGVTLNALAPGFHDTAALNRLINKKVEQKNISEALAKEEFARDTPVGLLGSPTDFASLAVWLLSAQSRFVTGQTISIDGGVIRGTMG
jgi:3-oxoacyl-[acyl-carrier protein] reductase